MTKDTSPLQPHSTAKLEYDAFISYRTSVNPDGPVGEELQKVLESYAVPASLAKNIVAPKKFRNRIKVFRDTTDLCAGGNLDEAIKERLRASRWLVVVCSPDMPRSTYCTEEVRYFEGFHGDGRILLLLIAGEPHESFPLLKSAAIRAGETLDTQGQTGKEPLAADVRANDVKSIIKKLRGRGIPKHTQARFKLLAPLLGCASPDGLIQRHRARVRRLIQEVIVAVLTVGLGVGWVISERIKKEAIRSEAEQLLAGMGLEDNLAEPEVDGLWKLAAHDKELRLEFLKQAVRIHSWRFNKRAAMMTRAVVGIDPAMAQKVEKEILRPLSQSEPTDPDGATTHALLTLNLPVRDPDSIVAAFKALLKQATFHDPSILEENPTSVTAEGTNTSRSLGYLFWQRIKSLDIAEAKAVVPHVLQTMRQVEDPSTFSKWALLLRELKWLTPGELRESTALATQKVEAQKQYSDRNAVGACLEPYAELWKGAGWEFGDSDVKVFVPAMIACLQTNDTVIGIEEWRDRLIGLISRAATNAKLVATPMLLTAMKRGSSPEKIDEVLVGVPGLLTPEFRKQRVKVLLDLVVGAAGKVPEPPFGHLAEKGVAKRLAIFPDDMSAEDLSTAQTHFRSLISATEDAGNVGDLSVEYAIEAIANLPPPLAPSEYWKLADAIVKAMKDSDSDLSVSLRSIADASEKLPKPLSIGAEGAEIHAAILKQLEAVDLDKLFFKARMDSWLKALWAFGGQLPVAHRERLTAKLLTKMESTPNAFDPVDNVAEMLFAIRCDSKSAGKIVRRIIDVCETEPRHLNLLYNSGVTLSTVDYREAVIRILNLINRKEGNTNDLMLLLERLPKPEEAAELATMKDQVLQEANSMHELTSLTKARLRSLLDRRPLRTLDIARSELLPALQERLKIKKLGDDLTLEFSSDDEERVLGVLIPSIQNALEDPECHQLIEVLQSTSYTLSENQRYQLVDTIIGGLGKAIVENEVEERIRLLSAISKGLDREQSKKLMATWSGKIIEPGYSRVSSIFMSMLSIPITLSPEDAAQFIDEILKAMNDPDKDSDLYDWYSVLGKVNPRLSDEQRHRAGSPAVAQLVKLQTPSIGEDREYIKRGDEVEKWLSALAQIPGGASLDDQRRARQLAMSILSTSSHTLETYPQENTEVIALLPGADASTLVELLKWPNLEARSIETVVAMLEKQNRQSFKNDVWQAVRWAQSAGLNVSSPPSRPPLRFPVRE